MSGGCSHQDVSAGDGRQFEVFHGTLLQLYVRVADLAIGAQHLLDGGLGLREQVDELDVGREEQGACGHRAQVELGMKQVELHQRAGGVGKRGTRGEEWGDGEESGKGGLGGWRSQIE